MKALVTGGAGFIGSAIGRKLAGLGHEVTILDNFSSGKKTNIDFECRVIEEDVVDIPLYEYILSGVDVVYHNAASKKNICLTDPVRDLEVNGEGTLRLLMSCVKMKVKRFIHASTGSVYGEWGQQINEHTPLNPVSYYGVSKLAGERYVQAFYKLHGLHTTILRYFHVYGPNQENNPRLGGVIAIFVNNILNGQAIVIHGDGNQQRSFTHVDDIVEANLIATSRREAVGQVYNCASGLQITINEAVELLSGVMCRKPKVVYGPPLVGDIYYFDVDNSAITKLGVRFRDFKTGINEYLSFCG